MKQGFPISLLQDSIASCLKQQPCGGIYCVNGTLVFFKRLIVTERFEKSFSEENAIVDISL